YRNGCSERPMLGGEEAQVQEWVEHKTSVEAQMLNMQNQIMDTLGQHAALMESDLAENVERVAANASTSDIHQLLDHTMLKQAQLQEDLEEEIKARTEGQDLQQVQLDVILKALNWDE
ncbi:hypothetical protein CYMTET_35408, partial [Cymbomonas tetramitiformis]